MNDFVLLADKQSGLASRMDLINKRHILEVRVLGNPKVDGAIVVTRGLPDFRALHFCNAEPDDLAVWAFDLLFYNGKDVRNLPLLERKALLTRLVLRAADNHLYLSRPSVTA